MIVTQKCRLLTGQPVEQFHVSAVIVTQKCRLIEYIEEVFVLELPLLVEKYQADILNKRYEQLRQLYNYVQGKLLRQYRYFEQMKDFQACKTFKEKRDFFRSHPFHIDGVLGNNKELLDITFDEYGINGFVDKMGKKLLNANTTYADLGITSTLLDRLSLAVWAAWEKMLYDNHARRVSFKKHGELNIFGSRKKTNPCRTRRVLLKTHRL